MKYIGLILLNLLAMTSAFAILDINEYRGEKLLLCGGHDSPGTGDSEGWYTIDNQGSLQPDYVGDLLKDQTYTKLRAKQFDMIIEENCDYRVAEEIHRKAPQLLKAEGILISRVCFSKNTSLRDLKETILSYGFRKVYFTNLNHMKKKEEMENFMKENDSLDTNLDLIYRFKSMKKEDIKKIFEKFHLDRDVFTENVEEKLFKCILPNEQGMGYQANFLAIR